MKTLRNTFGLLITLCILIMLPFVMLYNKINGIGYGSYFNK